MSPFLKHRAEHLTERMDDPECDRQKLFNTYRQLSELNGLISRWHSLFHAYILPLAEKGKTLHILDIGCGGGDVCLKLARWATDAGVQVEITGIDPDPRTADYLQAQETPDNVEFIVTDAVSLVHLERVYDVVISNYLLHHLTNEEIYRLCRQSEQLTRRMVIFNDLRRSKIAYAGFGLAAPWKFRESFTVRDGLTSIRRSFTRKELQRIVPSGWRVKKLIPYRLLAIFEKQ